MPRGGSRAATAIGLPKTTYARRLQRAQREVSLGTRPHYWPAVNAAVASLVRAAVAGPNGGSLLALAESALLAQIERRFPNDDRAGAMLLGTSLPTFRRRQTTLPLAS